VPQVCQSSSLTSSDDVFSFLGIVEGKLLSFFERVKKLEAPVSGFDTFVTETLRRHKGHEFTVVERVRVTLQMSHRPNLCPMRLSGRREPFDPMNICMS